MGKTEKEILDNFMQQLTFRVVKYAGKSKKKDWYLVGITNEMGVLIDEEGDIVAYVECNMHLYGSYKYTRDYVLLGGKLYQNEIYTGSKLKTIKQISKNEKLNESIEDMIFYNEAGLMELILDNQSVFMYDGELIDTGMIQYFAIPKKSVLKVYWRNEILRLEIIRGEVFYMSKTKKRMYSSKSWRGKKLQKRFFWMPSN